MSISLFARVVVGSMNPVKIAAVRAVVARLDPNAVVLGSNVDSGVPSQPFGDLETQQGAETRARAALKELGIATDELRPMPSSKKD